MKAFGIFAGFVVPVAFAAGPALAQQQPATTHTTVAVPAPATGPVVPAGRLEMTHGGWRSSKIVGADVYNDSHDKVGDIEDLIVDKDGKVTDAVISVGGFLGIGSKLVAVPFDQLRFEQQAENRTATAMAPASPGLAPPASPMAPQAAPIVGGAAPITDGTAPMAAGTAPVTAGTVAGHAAGNVPTTREANSASATAPVAVEPVPATGTHAAAVPATAPVGTMAVPATAQGPTYERTQIVLPGATKESLKSEPEFKYQT